MFKNSFRSLSVSDFPAGRKSLIHQMPVAVLLHLSLLGLPAKVLG